METKGNSLHKILRAAFILALAAVICLSAGSGSAWADTLPSKVTGVKAAYAQHYNYKLSWTKAAGAQKYEVYRSTSKSGTYKKVTTVTSCSYTAYVTPGKTYFYKVRGVKGTNKGTFSKILKVRRASESRLAAGIPLYWNEEINASLEEYDKAAGDSSFIYFTDAHWSANTQHSPSIINYLYKKRDFNMVMFGGDVIAGTQSSTAAAINEIKDFYSRFDEDINLMSTTGNHDYNTSSGDFYPLTEQTLYSLIYKREKSFATVSQYGRCAYTDDADSKVRYISMYFDGYLNNRIPQMGLDYDSSYPTQSELDWLKETVQDESLDEDWTIVLFTHGYFNFVRKGVTPTATASGKKLAKYIVSLSSQKATKADIGVWMVGHTHRDMTRKIGSGDDTIRIICTNCDTYVDGKISRGSGYWGGWTMVKGHDTEQVIDMVKLNTQKRKITLIRVGAGKNRTYSY